MAESSSASGPSRPNILEQIVETGKSAFDPSITDQATREAGLRSYNELIQSTKTWALLPALNTLVKPNMLPDWLREPLMQTLTLLPLRPDGVRGTMEFVFSVHPSTSSQHGSTASRKQGALITHEAVAVATRLLSSVPASMTPEAWFSGISEQLFHLMDESEGPELARTAAQIVGFGILGKKQYGAPGASGWNVFIQPQLNTLNPTLNPQSTTSTHDEDEVIDLSKTKVLVHHEDIERALKRLRILAMSNPSPGLCKRIIKPVLLQVWVLASWHNADAIAAPLQKAACDTLEIYLRLFGAGDAVATIIPDLLSKGESSQTSQAWEYRKTGQGSIEAVIKHDVSDTTGVELDWSQLQDKAAAFVKIVSSNCSAEDVSSTFLALFQKWVETSQASTGIRTVQIMETQGQEAQSALKDLVEITILQNMMEKASDKLIGHFDQLLDLICKVFAADEQSRLPDDTLMVILSLLNLVVTAPTFRKSDIESDKVGVVEQSLERLSGGSRPQISQTAANIALLLKYRTDLEHEDDSTTTPTARQLEDRRLYNLAMNYITTADNPPPVVSEGLNLLSGLITAQSSILDVTAVNVLLSNLLANNEDYINLRVIKMFTLMAENHPKSTLAELTDHYLDPQEKAQTDNRLRFGEALLQVIERLGETFTGEAATNTSETLLSIAGRRGYRPKTMAKQARDEKLQKLKEEKKIKAEDDDDDVDMDDDDRTEEEKARDDILAQIVRGWESKRGAEDVRMRSSALSIFGTALETSITGIGPSLVSNSVDLCINILTLEPEMEKAILRRAAILVVLGFVKALEKARETSRSIGFGLTDASREDIQRTLEYIAGTDNDGLVQQHARDVVESLEAWQMSSLLPKQEETSRTGLEALAGLSVNPVLNIGDVPGGASRPRIEEIE